MIKLDYYKTISAVLLPKSRSELPEKRFNLKLKFIVKRLFESAKTFGFVVIF